MAGLHGLALGYLVSGASLGAAAGAILGGPASDRFGRKVLLITDAGIYAAGAILSAVTWHAWVLLVARTLIGLAIGADSAIATAYIAEYAPKNRRGSLTVFIWKFLPETKELPVEEIVRVFEREQEGSALPKVA